MSTHPIIKKSFSRNFEKLDYIFLRQAIDTKGLLFNFGPKDSDFGPHETILSNLVGTLVKLSDAGQFVPYLAESFQNSSDGLTWRFKIRGGLVCEDGTKITAESFAQRITFSLKQYSKTSKVIDFELIDGWDDFVSGQAPALSGISFSDDELIFKLTAKPENFIGHLRLPYFGFWCESNFDSSGNFKDEQKIVSSAGYKLIHSERNLAVIEARKEWFSWTSETPNSISFRYVKNSEIKDSGNPTIVEILGRDKLTNLPSYQEIKSPPSLMWSMIVSPDKIGPLQISQNRQAFRHRISELKQNSTLFNSTFFYPSAQSALNLTAKIPQYTSEMNGYVLKFAFANRNYTVEEMSEIKRLVTESLKGSGSTVEFYIDDPLENNWRHRLLSNKEFDIRMNGVDQGGYPKNRTIKMMFCSNLGVCFPDPSGRICKLVAQQDQIGGPIPPDYIKEFNQAVYEDSVVIPLTHFGSHWLASPHIDLKTLPPSSGIFHFEGIRLK